MGQTHSDSCEAIWESPCVPCMHNFLVKWKLDRRHPTLGVPEKATQITFRIFKNAWDEKHNQIYVSYKQDGEDRIINYVEPQFNLELWRAYQEQTKTKQQKKKYEIKCGNSDCCYSSWKRVDWENIKATKDNFKQSQEVLNALSSELNRYLDKQRKDKSKEEQKLKDDEKMTSNTDETEQGVPFEYKQGDLVYYFINFPKRRPRIIVSVEDPIPDTNGCIKIRHINEQVLQYQRNDPQNELNDDIKDKIEDRLEKERTQSEFPVKKERIHCMRPYTLNDLVFYGDELFRITKISERSMYLFDVTGRGGDFISFSRKFWDRLRPAPFFSVGEWVYNRSEGKYVEIKYICTALVGDDTELSWRYNSDLSGPGLTECTLAPANCVEMEARRKLDHWQKNLSRDDSRLTIIKAIQEFRLNLNDDAFQGQCKEIRKTFNNLVKKHASGNGIVKAIPETVRAF